jgi:hypothetical protein
MRILLPLLLSVTVLSANAQTIQDFPDFRPKKDNLSRCNDPVVKNDLVFFTLAGLNQRVGQPQATSLPVTAYGTDYIQFQAGDVQVVIRGTAFEQGKRKLGYIDKHLVRIDNKPYFGNYGLLPTEAIQSVTLINGKDTVKVPPAAYADLYEPLFMGNGNTTHDGVYLSPDKHTIYIYMLNKEVNGFYEVTWVIRDKQFIRRVVDTDI